MLLAGHACDRFFSKPSALPLGNSISLFPPVATMAESLTELQVQYQDFLQGEVRLSTM